MRSKSKKPNVDVTTQNQDHNDISDVVDIQLNYEQVVDGIDIQLTSNNLSDQKKKSKQTNHSVDSKVEPPKKKNKTVRDNSVKPNKRNEVDVSELTPNISSSKSAPKKKDSLTSTPKDKNSTSKNANSLIHQSLDVTPVTSRLSTDIMDISSPVYSEVFESVSKWMPLIKRTKGISSIPCDTNSSSDYNHIFHAKKHDSICTCQSHALIISYEMCDIKNPLTQEIEKAIIRFTILNGNNPSEVIVDFLIKPKFPINITRPHFNGISSIDISNCEFTLSDAQFILSVICCSETVLIGHNLEAVLNLLQFSHSNCVDLSLVFGSKRHSALDDISRLILQKDLLVDCDSVYRGKIIGEIANHLLTDKKNFYIKSQNKLIATRIPESITRDDIMNLFINQYSIIPESISDFQKKAQFSSCEIIFQSPEDVDMVYNAIPTRPEALNSNKPYKRVILNLTGRPYFLIRKFDENDDSPTPKR